MTSPVLEPKELEALLQRARSGDGQALEALVVSLQHGVYRLALRMTACPDDAADATQEVLIKVVTRLDAFRGEASVRTWAYRIAVHHLLDRKKSRVERMNATFERLGADLLDGLAADPDPDPLAAEEVRIGCTLAMLTCLDREHRVAYVLVDVFDLEHGAAAEICDIEQAALRQRLSRARRALEAFTQSYCGRVAPEVACHCSKRVARAADLGRIHREAPRLAADVSLAEARSQMERLFDTAALLRSHSEPRAPERVLNEIRAAIASTPLLT